MLDVFELPFMKYALAAGLLVGCTSAYLGVYVVLKRIVFVGVALSEMAALGVVLGVTIGINPHFAAFAVTILSIIAFAYHGGRSTAPAEGIIGFAYASAAGFALVLLAKYPSIEALEGVDIVSGNLLFVTKPEVMMLGAVCLAVLVVQVLFYRGFLFSSFDKTTAVTSGIHASVYDIVWYVSVGVVIALSMKAAGTLFVFASLVIPPLTAMKCFRRLPLMFLGSDVFAAASVFFGLVVSFKVDTPAGPTIVAGYSALFVAAGVLSFVVRGVGKVLLPGGKTTGARLMDS